ncbi:MAG: B12-binding domain-containing radical SAM protein [Desulfobacteraceae bacterium]|nr:B12-binding domain-containing radical SAM protein [Desulfobacteraceae bacterium]
MRKSPIKKVLIVTLKDFGEDVEYTYSCRENLGVEYILASLRSRGHLADSINENIKGDSHLYQVDLSEYDVVGLSLPFWENRKQYVRLINKLELPPATFVIAGGHAATIGAEYFLQKCPMLTGVIMGEGEVTFSEFLAGECMNTSIPGLYSRNGFRKRELGNIDTLPFPARDELLRSVCSGAPFKEAYIASTRGCTNRCAFCSIPTYYGLAHQTSWRERSVSNVCLEIDDIMESYPQIEALSFTDDNFLGFKQEHKKRAIEIARHIFSKKNDLSFELTCRADSVDYNTFEQLVEYGLSGVYLGIESGVQRVLNLFKKGTTVEQNIKSIEILAELGVGCDLGFIMFSSSITIDEFRENLLFLRNILQSFPVYVEPASVFRSLRHYPKDLGRTALTDDDNCDVPCDGSVDLLRTAIEHLWHSQFEHEFLKLEQLAFSESKENNLYIQKLRAITLDMIDVGLYAAREVQSCRNIDFHSISSKH